MTAPAAVRQFFKTVLVVIVLRVLGLIVVVLRCW